MRLPSRDPFYLVAVLGLACSMPPDSLAQVAERVSTTAWKAGHFAVDAAGLLGRSDIVLGQPNTKPAEAMPMGNGRLGIAVWAADGFTAQLNRADTLPSGFSWPDRHSRPRRTYFGQRFQRPS